MNYLINATETYRVPTVEDAERLHDELRENPNFTLSSFGYKTKYIKEKGEIVEEYQLVKVGKSFNEEKEPDTYVEVLYEV